MKVQGWDLALNHSACVELTDGKLTNYWYITDRKGDADKGKGRGTYHKKPDRKKQPDTHVSAMERLVFMEKHFMSWAASAPDVVNIENYALGASTNAYHIGELGGVARMLLWQAGIPFRLTDPSSLKMYIAHNGAADKGVFEAAVKERFGVDFSGLNSTDKRQTSEDLADAYGLAFMVWQEALVRNGELKLSDLHKKEIQVFNRITKAMPACLVDRDWTKEP